MGECHVQNTQNYQHHISFGALKFSCKVKRRTKTNSRKKHRYRTDSADIDREQEETQIAGKIRGIVKVKNFLLLIIVVQNSGWKVKPEAVLKRKCLHTLISSSKCCAYKCAPEIST